jgi:hypothetical protein
MSLPQMEKEKQLLRSESVGLATGLLLVRFTTGLAA